MTLKTRIQCLLQRAHRTPVVDMYHYLSQPSH